MFYGSSCTITYPERMSFLSFVNGGQDGFVDPKKNIELNNVLLSAALHASALTESQTATKFKHWFSRPGDKGPLVYLTNSLHFLDINN